MVRVRLGLRLASSKWECRRRWFSACVTGRQRYKLKTFSDTNGRIVVTKAHHPTRGGPPPAFGLRRPLPIFRVPSALPVRPSFFMTVDDFIERWSASSASEHGNQQLFLSELCDLLDLPHPDPAGRTWSRCRRPRTTPIGNSRLSSESVVRARQRPSTRWGT
jgi:hypothetical protein